MECPVCFETFRTPKSLSCGHSVCYDCCMKLAQRTNSIKCPLCQQCTNIPPGGLPTAYALQDMIGWYEVHQKVKDDECKQLRDTIEIYKADQKLLRAECKLFEDTVKKYNADQKAKRDECKQYYQCFECKSWCTAGEAWVDDRRAYYCITRVRCSHCVITNKKIKTETDYKSVASVLKRHEEDLADFKREVEDCAHEQDQWSTDTTRNIDHIIEMARTTKEAVQEMSKNFQSLVVKANSLEVPDAPEELQRYGESIGETKSALKRISNIRRRTTCSMKSVLTSLTTGLQDMRGSDKNRFLTDSDDDFWG